MRPRAAGVVGVVAVLGTALLLAVLARPVEAGHRYRAVFARAGQGLAPGRSEVKVRGVRVGRVEGVRLRPDGRVLVTLRSSVRVTEGSRATVEPVSVFGPKDVAVELGAGPALPDGGTLRATEPPVDPTDIARPAHDLLSAIDADEVAGLLRTLAAGLGGRETALRRTLTQTGQVVDATHRNRAVLRGLVNDIAGVGGVLGTRGDALGGTVADLNRVAPVVYERPDRVARLLEETSRLAGTVAGTLNRQGENLGELGVGLGRPVGVLAQQAHQISPLITALESFFNKLATMIKTPGPEGTLLALSVAHINLDPCTTFTDICTPLPAPRN